MKSKDVLRMAALLLAFSLVLAGCGSGTSQVSSEQGGSTKGSAASDKETKASDKPVTLQLATDGAAATLDDTFQQVVNGFLQKKYPNITINFNPEAKGTTVTDLVAAGTVPDIIVTYNGKLASYRDMALVFDMTPLLKANNVDTSRFETNYLQDTKNASDKGELYGLPINVNYHAMYYNKDIFDKFGTPYPTDGMTWEQVVTLARKVTRMEGGTQYRGLDPGNGIIWMSQPLSVAAIDPKTDVASANNDKWKRVFELAKSIYQIPGNEKISTSPKDQFMKNKTLGILLDLNILSQLAAAQADGLKWDVAQYPSYTEAPNTYGNASVYVMIATTTTKYKDEVAKVIDLITSEEVQLGLSKAAKLSPLKSQKVKDALGSDQPTLKDKHLPSIFKSHPVPYPIASKYRSKAESILSGKFTDYLNGKVDVNTALKQADEEINKMSEAERGGK